MDIYHLKPTEDDWELIREGTEKPVASFDGRQVAILASKALIASLGGTLKIYRPDETIEEILTWPPK
jgi:hypothetical protein